MYPRFRPVPAATLIPLLLFTFGCSQSRHESTESYYLVATNIKLPYWQAAFEGLTLASTNLKVRAEMVGPATYDPKAQQEFFQQVVAKKPSGIMRLSRRPRAYARRN